MERFLKVRKLVTVASRQMIPWLAGFGRPMTQLREQERAKKRIWGNGRHCRIKQYNRLRLNCELRNRSLYRGFRNLSPTGRLGQTPVAHVAPESASLILWV